jgi:hypothetical protein
MKLLTISRMLGLASLSFAAVALAAGGCSSSSTKSPGSGGSGGSGGTSSAGTTGAGGTPVDASAGSICSGVMPPASGLIADFGTFSNATFGSFGIDNVTGGTYVSGQDTYLMEDFGGASWHLTGVAYGQMSYFGLYWNCANAPGSGCTLDVSRYTGIQFTIKGNVGPDHQLGFSVGRREDDTATENAQCGTCVATHTPTSVDCHGPRKTISVPSDGSTATIKVLWTDLTGGLPVDSLTSSVPITGIIWFFHDATGITGCADAGAPVDGGPTGACYGVDLTIDDIQFTTAATDGGGN